MKPPKEPSHHPDRWKETLFWLYHFEKGDLALIILFGVLFSVFSLVTPIGVQALVNTLLFTGLLQPILVLVAAIFVGLAIASIFRIIQVYLIELLQRRLMVRTTYEIGKKIKKSDPEFLHTTNGLELVNRAFDIERVQKSASGLLIDGMAFVLQAVVGLTMLAFYHELLLLFDLLLIGGVYVLIKYIGYNGTKSSIKESKSKHELIAWLESLISKRLLLSHPRADRLAERKTSQYISHYLDSRQSHYKILFSQIISTYFLQMIASAGLLGIGGYLVVRNEISVGQLVAAEIIISGILYSLTRFQKNLENFYDLASGLDKVGELLELPQQKDQDGPSHTFPERPAIEFENVVLKDLGASRAIRTPISFRVPSGEHLVIQGRQGTGKSNLLHALCGTHSIKSGLIRIDQLEMNLINPDAIREQVLYINSDGFLPGTLIENLTFGDEDYSLQDITECLTQVGLLKIVEANPDGTKMEIRSNGFPLSPGQRIQLSLARCFLFKPKIIILDQGFDFLSDEIRDSIISVLMDPKMPWTIVATTFHEKVADRFSIKLNLDQFNKKTSGKVA